MEFKTNRRLTALAAAAAACVLAGCVSTPVPDSAWRADAVGPAWEQLPAGPVDPALRSRFWSAWESPELVRLQTIALERNPDIASAAATVKAAAATLDLRSWQRLPGGRVSLQDGVTRASSHTVHNSKGGLDADWRISLMGSEYFAERAQELTGLSAQYAFAALEEQILAQVAEAYLQYSLAGERIRVLDDLIASQKDALELVESRHAAGLADDSEYLLAQGQLLDMEKRVPERRAELEKARHLLSRLTLTPWAGLHLDDAAAGIPEPPRGLAVSIPAEVLSHRSDVAASRMKVLAAAEDVNVAKADFYPSLSITGSLGARAASISALGVTGNSVASLAGALDLPILNYGRLAAARRGAEARLDGAVADYGRTLAAALEDVGNAVSIVVSTEEKRPLESDYAAKMEEAASLSLMEYEAGTGDFNRYLIAKKNALNARDSELINRYNHARAVVELYRATGGAWRDAPNEGNPNHE